MDTQDYKTSSDSCLYGNPKVGGVISRDTLNTMEAMQAHINKSDKIVKDKLKRAIITEQDKRFLRDANIIEYVH